MAEGFKGRSRESHVPAALEMLGIPYTGSDPLSLAVSLHKPTAKKVLLYHGVPTPAFRVIDPGDSLSELNLGLPLFVKPAHEGSSMGISPTSKVTGELDLVKQVELIHRTYKQSALVEEFVGGREFTVGILGNEDPFYLPIMEINYADCPHFHGEVYTRQFKAEWSDLRFYTCPASIPPELESRLRSVSLAAYRALECKDVGRVDVRLGPKGLPYVLEVNPLPGLSPGFSDLPRMAEAGGIPFEDLVNHIMHLALDRYGMPHASESWGIRRFLTA